MRITAFRIGMLSGVVLFAAAASAIYLMVRDPSPAPYNFEASTAGADLSRHGARTVEVRTTYGSMMRQTCNGRCDDLSYKIKIAGENGLQVMVRDAAGACLSCDGGAYVDSASHVVVAHIGGVEKLEAKVDDLRRQADGSMKPVGVTGKAEATPNIKP